MKEERYRALKKAVGPLANARSVIPVNPAGDSCLVTIVARNSNASLAEAKEFLGRYFRELAERADNLSSSC